MTAGGASNELKRLLKKVMNSTDKTELVDTLRALFRVEMVDSDKALITKEVLAKVKVCRDMRGNVSVRADLLLKMWADDQNIQEESINDEESFRPMRTSSPGNRVECGECQKTFSNKANLVRHQRAEHAKRSLVEEEQQPLKVTRRARIGN